MTVPQLTGSLATVTDYWYQKFTDLSDELGLMGVAYGDQTSVPFSPYLCVEPVVKNNEQKNASGGRMLNTTMNVVIIIYLSKVATEQMNARDALEFSETVESLINTDRKAGGLVINCLVSNLEAGYIERSGSLMRACRMNIEHTTQYLLPS